MDDDKQLKMVIVLIELLLSIDFILVKMVGVNEVLGSYKKKH
jgi:hypothetical protein